MAMPMEIDPDGGGPVEILLPFSIDQVGAFPPLDNERLLLFPFLHLCEGMPEIGPVPIRECGRAMVVVAHAIQSSCEAGAE